jgi:hypothetical protein
VVCIPFAPRKTRKKNNANCATRDIPNQKSSFTLQAEEGWGIKEGKIWLQWTVGESSPHHLAVQGPKTGMGAQDLLWNERRKLGVSQDQRLESPKEEAGNVKRG